MFSWSENDSKKKFTQNNDFIINVLIRALTINISKLLIKFVF